jgi:DNA-binding response OmpR family regulator
VITPKRAGLKMKKIWIVDDDEEMTRAVQLMLRLIDCDATGYFSARSATKALLAGNQPDLLILDINMPEVSGLDLLEFLRRRSEWKNLPVVMLSTEAADVTVDKAMKLGADGYVTKPVTIEELERAINIAFQKHTKG